MKRPVLLLIPILALGALTGCRTLDGMISLADRANYTQEDAREELAALSAAFGPEKGLAYFQAGLSLQDAQAAENANRIKSIDERLADLEERLPEPESEPVQTNAPPVEVEGEAAPREIEAGEADGAGLRRSFLSPEILALHRESLRLLGRPDPWAETETRFDRDLAVLESQVPVLVDLNRRHDRGALFEE